MYFYRKSIMIFCLMALVTCASTAWGFASWVELTNPLIDYQGDGMYRFRVDVAWGGETYIDPTSGFAVEPILDRLWITNPFGMAVTWTGNHSGALGFSYAGDWYGGVESPSFMGSFGLHGPQFGWDFVPDSPLADSYVLNYTAFMAWLDYDYDQMMQVEGGTETHEGQLQVSVIPEPATLMLLGFGFVGLVIYMKKHTA